MSGTRRVAVTGLGLITPIGLNEKSFWTNLEEGRCGTRKISAFDPAPYKAQNGAEVNSTELENLLRARNWRSIDRSVDMALLSAGQALEQANLLDPATARAANGGIGTIVGSGGPLLSLEESYKRYAESGVRGIRPTTIVRNMGNIAASQVSMKFGLTGPNYVVISACSSSTNAIGITYRMIRDGYADCVLCGGTESFFAPGLYGAWDKLGVMSQADDPATACRPFDKARDGFVLGEGAAMLVLESMETANRRGARIRGEICGYGESSDAEHLTRPNAESQAGAIRAAMDSAGVSPAEIGYVNAHGTATEANDECECRSIRMALGAAADNALVASNKSFFGHLLGAAGAVETAATLLSLEHGRIPPNLNLDEPDEKCDLKFVGPQAVDFSKTVAMKNSFGFGGGNAVLILRKYSGA